MKCPYCGHYWPSFVDLSQCPKCHKNLDNELSYDEEEDAVIEHLGNDNTPQCWRDPPRHRWQQLGADEKVRICILCGIAELVTGDGHTRA